MLDVLYVGCDHLKRSLLFQVLCLSVAFHPCLKSKIRSHHLISA